MTGTTIHDMRVLITKLEAERLSLLIVCYAVEEFLAGRISQQQLADTVKPHLEKLP